MLQCNWKKGNAMLHAVIQGPDAFHLVPPPSFLGPQSCPCPFCLPYVTADGERGSRGHTISRARSESDKHHFCCLSIGQNFPLAHTMVSGSGKYAPPPCSGENIWSLPHLYPQFTFCRGTKARWQLIVWVPPLPTHVPHCPTKLRLQNTSSKVKLWRISIWWQRSVKPSGEPFWAWGCTQCSGCAPVMLTLVSAVLTPSPRLALKLPGRIATTLISSCLYMWKFWLST